MKTFWLSALKPTWVFLLSWFGKLAVMTLASRSEADQTLQFSNGGLENGVLAGTLAGLVDG